MIWKNRTFLDKKMHFPSYFLQFLIKLQINFINYKLVFINDMNEFVVEYEMLKKDKLNINVSV